ncbi:hypothetical protein K788_0002062 (plasmid) [Paraburkholderia caribensis MBA4]|uniref:Uncharacterized protein n=1 Tax=Paraburkholderia caribensis MBA4 TaxID=1323664 RepID=A0A0P0RQ69_9BURK|nr:hypothetical protein K788_0002062 [Paraburkholderia caribensis MBA4]
MMGRPVLALRDIGKVINITHGHEAVAVVVSAEPVMFW